jgi:hypothetical protein
MKKLIIMGLLVVGLMGCSQIGVAISEQVAKARGEKCKLVSTQSGVTIDYYTDFSDCDRVAQRFHPTLICRFL